METMYDRLKAINTPERRLQFIYMVQDVCQGLADSLEAITEQHFCDAGSMTDKEACNLLRYGQRAAEMLAKYAGTEKSLIDVLLDETEDY